MVVFGLFNGLAIGITSLLEEFLDRKPQNSLSPEEMETIEVIEELEKQFLLQGKDPNHIKLEDVNQFIKERIETSKKEKYTNFLQKIESLKEQAEKEKRRN